MYIYAYSAVLVGLHSLYKIKKKTKQPPLEFNFPFKTGNVPTFTAMFWNVGILTVGLMQWFIHLFIYNKGIFVVNKTSLDTSNAWNWITKCQSFSHIINMKAEQLVMYHLTC